MQKWVAKVKSMKMMKWRTPVPHSSIKATNDMIKSVRIHVYRTLDIVENSQKPSKGLVKKEVTTLQ